MTLQPWPETRFASHLLSQHGGPPADLTSWTGHNSQKRFGVYRNNVRGALTEALAVRYPVVQRLVGEEFFRAMATEFALANLPASPVLIEYGANFADFIASFAPAASLTYLADVARLESAYWQAYHAADDVPLAAYAFQQLEPAALAGMKLTFISSCQILTSAHPIVSIWLTNTNDATVQPVDLSLAEDALVSRPALSVEVRKLPAGAAVFLTLLQQGKCLGEAADLAAERCKEFDLTQNLAGLIQSGIAREIST